MSYNIKEMVKNKIANFQFYRKGELWYKTECGFLFPVPIEDIGDATFNSQEKAMLLMRYIRKWIAACNEQEKTETLFRKNPINGKTEIVDAVSGIVVAAQG